MSKARANKPVVQKRSQSGKSKGTPASDQINASSNISSSYNSNNYNRSLVTKENYDQNREGFDLYADSQPTAAASSQFDNVVTTMIVEVREKQLHYFHTIHLSIFD